MSYHVSFSFSSFVSFLALFQVLQCVCLIYHVFSVFSPYSRTYGVHYSFLTFFSVFHHIPDQTVFVSHFPCWSVFSPYSRFFCVHFLFFTFFKFLAIFLVIQCLSLIFHVFSPFSSVLSHSTGKKDITTSSSAASFIASSGEKIRTPENVVAYIALSHGFSAPDVACQPLIHCSPITPLLRPEIGSFSVFLDIFQVKQCLCHIFHIFQFSRHIQGPTM